MGLSFSLVLLFHILMDLFLSFPTAILSDPHGLSSFFFLSFVQRIWTIFPYAVAASIALFFPCRGRFFSVLGMLRRNI